MGFGQHVFLLFGGILVALFFWIEMGMFVLLWGYPMGFWFVDKVRVTPQKYVDKTN
jgi:hypothetical protein